MARKNRQTEKKQAPEPPAPPRPTPRPRYFAGVLAVMLGLLTGVALGDYTPAQNPVFTADPTSQNIVGELGLQIAYRTIQVFGAAAWVLPAWLLLLGYLFLASPRSVRPSRFLAVVVLLSTGSLLLAVIETQWGTPSHVRDDVPPGSAGYVDAATWSTNAYPFGIGGWVGSTAYRQLLYHSIGPAGTAIIAGALFGYFFVLLIFDNLGRQGWRALAASARSYGRWRRARKARHDVVLPSGPARPKAKSKAATDDSDAPQGKKRSWVGKLFGGLRRKKKKPAAPADETVAPAAAPKQDAPARDFSWEPDGVFPDEDLVVQATIGDGDQAKARKSPSRKVAAADPDDVVPPTPAKTTSRAPAPEPQAPDEIVAEEPAPTKKAAAKAAPEPDLDPDAPPPGKPALKIVQSEETRKAAKPPPTELGDYKLPTLERLTEPAGTDAVGDEEQHQQTAEALVRTLDEFGVNVSLGEVHAGPVITRYDVYPAAGVRVEKIVNLDKNLALGLKATSVRILAPVPGKGCVGIEVPNADPQMVCIRDILESENWAKTKAEIPIALGKEVSGKPLIADLTKMPHLLIAGSTGSGKTVCINAVITSLLFRLGPKDVRFVMVDPKIVEMQVYNSLPHMLIPVVTDPKKVPGALKYLLNEMERRYQLFAQHGVRNIAGFNAKMTKDKEALAASERAEMSPEERAQLSNIEVPRDEEIDPAQKLPYIVCIIDELADLMMVAPGDVETGITRLAQLARAAGIHLIVATQRPSVNVITGTIKANLPSRIAFKVASKVDSRTILDGNGAESLIGRGDMLFLPPGSADLIRSQGAFVSDDEITGLVEEVVKKNGEPIFDEAFQASVEQSIDDSEDGGSGGDPDDADEPLIRDALDVLRTTNRASTSMLQRKMRIGYNRAARIMEKLEELGYVGPDNGAQPREILRDLSVD